MGECPNADLLTFDMFSEQPVSRMPSLRRCYHASATPDSTFDSAHVNRFCHPTVAPHHSCDAIALADCIFYALTTPITALMFWFRANAVYNNDKFAKTFFTLCWLSVAGCYAYDAALALPTFAHLPNSLYCSIVLHGRRGGVFLQCHRPI